MVDVSFLSVKTLPDAGAIMDSIFPEYLVKVPLFPSVVILVFWALV